MTKSNVRIVNSIGFTNFTLTFGEWTDSILKGKIISVKEFLQRPLLKEEWTRNDYKAARDYMASVWKGTFGLDGFSMVSIDALIEKLQTEFSQTDNSAYDKALQELIQHRDKGVLFLCLDGQSRSFLSMIPYVKGEVNGLGDSADGIQLEIDGKIDKQLLKTTKYLDLPTEVRGLLDAKELQVTLVSDFYTFKDIIDTLVNKQKGWSWSPFQVVKQENRFGKFVVGLIELFSTREGERFSSLWNEKMTRVKNEFKFNRDGHQNFGIVASTLLTDGQWSDKVASKLRGVESPDKNSFERVFKYSNELLGIRKDSTVISELINWIVFRWVVDGGSRTNPLYLQLGHTGRYKVINPSALLEKFITTHLVLKGSKKNPHPVSWMMNPLTNEWVRIDQGYSHANENQSTQSITSRMTTFISHFPWKECIEEGILQEHQAMPSMTDVVLKNNFEDLNGKPLNVLNLGQYDRSHKVSQKNNGDNGLDNLVVEDASSNRSRGSENI